MFGCSSGRPEPVRNLPIMPPDLTFPLVFFQQKKPESIRAGSCGREIGVSPIMLYARSAKYSILINRFVTSPVRYGISANLPSVPSASCKTFFDRTTGSLNNAMLYGRTKKQSVVSRYDTPIHSSRNQGHQNRLRDPVHLPCVRY
jgi:hypothetical protein